MGKGTKSRDWVQKQVFTTGEAAEICKVSQQTIIRCFDSGRLQGFRVPGSRFRRIPRAELIRFMQENEIPIDILESDARRVLVVDDDQDILDLMSDVLGQDDRFNVQTASTGYEAGMMTEQFKPHVVLLDYMLPDLNGNIVCKRIRANPALAATRIIVISGVVNRDEIESMLNNGADDFIKKPFDITDLMERLCRLVGL